MVDALVRHRGKGPQVIRVEKMLVADGGQAVVGNVTAQPPQAAAPLALERGASPMPMAGAVPVPGGEGAGVTARNTGRDPMAPAASSNLCGARTRQGGACGNFPMTNGRCRFHGGLSTGPRTAEGLEQLRAARTVHGAWGREGRELRALVRELQAKARRVCEAI